MGKISPVSIKYIIHANLQLTGVAEKPDIIGAVFGQTEGLLGNDLELRELQKSGRIGRIDVNLEVKNGKTEGEILLPSSMDKSETAIIAAALETIERVGPCNAKIVVGDIEDVRISKRNFVRERAKELLHTLVGELPDSRALTDDVTRTVRTSDIVEYGKDRLPAGPEVETADEVIIVEGRADVMTLLGYGFKNIIGINGTKASDTIFELTKKKKATVFVDGDRGGDLIIKKLNEMGEIDSVAKAPDGKEVEELTMKEIHKALRQKISFEQAIKEINGKNGSSRPQRRPVRQTRMQRTSYVKRDELPSKYSEQIKKYSEELLGTRGAYVLGSNLNVLGKIPTKELTEALENMPEGVFAIVLDGTADQELATVADEKRVKFVIAKDIDARSRSVRLIKTDTIKI